MASVHTASCECGYRTQIAIGGTKASFLEHSTFPYYCQHCGLVSVNIADFIGERATKEALMQRRKSAHPPTCPKCGSKDLDQYGISPASMQVTPNRRALQAWNFVADEKGNLCPDCKQMTLVFKSANICAD